MARIPTLLPYAFAVLAVTTAILLALLLRWGLQPGEPGQIAGPLLLIAVAFGARYGGYGPGMLGAGLSCLSFEYLFWPPIHAIEPALADLPRVGAFLAASLMVSRFTEKRKQVEAVLHRINDELRGAQAIQQSLLPTSTPTIPGFDVAGRSVPAGTVAGDFFDYIPLLDDALGIVVADVTGHGLGPAILGAETRAYLRALAMVQDDIGQILTTVNRILAQERDFAFVTMFFVAVDLRRFCFTYCAAGHEAYLLDPIADARRLSSMSLPLGVCEDLVVPATAPHRLVPGQVMLLLTDGAFEMRSRDGVYFGIERCLDVVRKNSAKPAREILDLLFEELRRFADGSIQADDITVVVLKVQSVSDPGAREMAAKSWHGGRRSARIVAAALGTAEK